MLPAAVDLPRIYCCCRSTANAYRFVGVIIPLDSRQTMTNWSYWGPAGISSYTVYSTLAKDSRNRGKNSLFVMFPNEASMMLWVKKTVHRVKNPHLYD